jgi:ubiquitin C-terminal hydrolase
MNLFYLLHSDQYSSIFPMPFKQVIGDAKSMYCGSQQQDAHEFLTFLLDYLHDALDKVSRSIVSRGSSHSIRSSREARMTQHASRVPLLPHIPIHLLSTHFT